jgi:hypothetical protein
MGVDAFAVLAVVLGGGVLGAPVAAAAATPTRYIVRLVGGGHRMKVVGLATQVRRQFSSALPGFTAELTAAKAAELRCMPGVVAIDPVHEMRISDTQTRGALGSGPGRPADAATRQLLRLDRRRCGRDGVRPGYRRHANPQCSSIRR